MNYELAKKLKDAGFPFKDNSHSPAFTIRPTLSELIEACGDDFGALERKQIGNSEVNWFVYQNLPNEFGVKVQVVYDAKSPTEAVANLYLKLHERK